MKTLNIPRLILGALRGGSGKTIITIGLLRGLRDRGIRALAFKKGPDFIDPGWLSLASGLPCRNLDAYLMDEKRLYENFVLNSVGQDISIIEGNRGLYDGMDSKGRYSTAELAKLLGAPMLIIVDVTMSSRTVAALIKGCQVFDPGLNLAGVILNRVANQRQERLIREAIEMECRIPVLGSVPRQTKNPFPERHMGLIPHQEQERALEAILWAKTLMTTHLDMEAILSIARSSPPMEMETVQKGNGGWEERPRIGVLLDKAFWFYYPENMEALKSHGAQLVTLDSTRERSLTGIDGLYIGGGFPETQAESLAANNVLRNQLKAMIEEGLPVYAECGGLIYLGKNILYQENTYPMLGIFDVDFRFQKRPVGHGYTEFRAVRPNPFFEEMKNIRGHEFHYSIPEVRKGERLEYLFQVLRGTGFEEGMDGLIRKNVLGTYMHVHALGEDSWARGLVGLSRVFRAKRAFQAKERTS